MKNVQTMMPDMKSKSDRKAEEISAAASIRTPSASTTDRLLDAAAALMTAFPFTAHEAEGQTKRDAFTTAYRRWLVDHASVAGSPDERMEKVRLVLTAAVAAPDLGRAIDIIIRFGKLVTPELSPVVMLERGDMVVLRFNRTHHGGPAGLIGELWPLTLMLSQLECLVGHPIGGIQGSVRNRAEMPEDAMAILFDQPILFEQDELALLLPKRHLLCAVVAQYEEASAFLPRLMPDALVGKDRHRTEFRTLLKGILRLDRLGGLEMSTLESVALRLGYGQATVRRKLAEEGCSFRQLRDEVNDDIAKRWLVDGRMKISVVADRLGFSDAYSFARFFERMNGCTPSRYRRRTGGDITVSGNVVLAGERAIAACPNHGDTSSNRAAVARLAAAARGRA